MTFFSSSVRRGAWIGLSLGALVACGGSTGGDGDGSTGGASSGGSGTGGTGGGTGGNVPAGSCAVGDEVHSDGASFRIECNDCWCDGGSVTCTQIACDGPPCEFEGRTLEPGETIPTACGAGICTCGESGPGEVVCDEPGCLPCGRPGDDACEGERFCRLYPDAACGDAPNVQGDCELRPSGCNLIYAPVCGCDGKTYGSECAAHAEGVNVASEGECP